jgi:hypothetical protein
MISGCSHTDSAQAPQAGATTQFGSVASTANVPPEAQQLAAEQQTQMQIEGAKHKAAERPVKQ